MLYWSKNDNDISASIPSYSDADNSTNEKEVKMSEKVKYHTKLVGVTFEGRQDIIKVLTGDEPLRLRREAENEYDPNAVAVDVAFDISDVPNQSELTEWQPIGYIAKDKNADLASYLDQGVDATITLSSKTGGEMQKNGKAKSFGVNVEISYEKPEAKPVEDKVVEPTVDYKNMLNLALQGLGLVESKEHTEMYHSQLLGLSTEVTIKEGHVSIPGYMGGSSFPKQFYPEFEKESRLQDILDKHFKPEQHELVKASITEMWERSGESSNDYGTAVHAAMENYDKFRVLGDKIKSVKKFKTKEDVVGPNKALSSNPFLAKIVQDFHDKFGGDYVRLTEQFIWLHDKELAGAIDRVKVVDAAKKIIRIQDYKTNGNIHSTEYQFPDSPFRGIGKKALKEGAKQKDNIVEDTLLGKYWLQLSFYAYILRQYGYTVEGLDIYWLNPEKLVKGENAWEEFSHDVIDITGVLNV